MRATIPVVGPSLSACGSMVSASPWLAQRSLFCALAGRVRSMVATGAVLGICGLSIVVSLGRLRGSTARSGKEGEGADFEAFARSNLGKRRGIFERRMRRHPNAAVLLRI